MHETAEALLSGERGGEMKSCAGLTGVGPEAEKLWGETLVKKKKKENHSLVRNARNSTAPQFSTDYVTCSENKILAPAQCFPCSGPQCLFF